ncbi:MAG TPA: PEGA domain-containing protein [Candidatus Polarisedimenticolia bacterium]|nr:PEGA domain-containing protein [Candidatus Polarisedimenticolia bacterium]
MTRSAGRSSGSARAPLRAAALALAAACSLLPAVLGGGLPARAQEEEDIGGIIERYRGLLTLANQKLEDLDLPEALARYTEVIDGYKTGRLPSGTPLTRQIVGQAYDGRARTYANLGRAAEAEADFESLIRYDPAWPIDRAQVSPKIVALYDKVRAKVIARLAIQTEPPGAAVFLNGEPIGRSPVFDRELPAGRYTVKVEAQGFEPLTETLELQGGSRVDKALRLVPNARSIVVFTSPAGARVSVDGQARGTTFGSAGPEHQDLASGAGLALGDLSAPLLVEHLAPGNHLLKIEKECHEPQLLSFGVSIDPNDNSPVRFEPVRLTASLGSIAVESLPPGADVLVDGQPAGKTPLRKDGICTGPHAVVLKHPEAGQWIGSLQVMKGQRAQLKERLRMTLAFAGMTSAGPAGQPAAGETELSEALARLKSMNVVRPGAGLPEAWLARGRQTAQGGLPAEWVQGAAEATGADVVLAASPAEGGFERRAEVLIYAARHPGMPPDRLLVRLDDPAALSQFIARLDRPTPLTRPWLGVRAIEIHRAVNPVAIRVQPDSPAAKAGVKLGESIISLGGRPLASPRDLASAISELPEGAQASLAVQPPRGMPRQVNVALGSSPVMAAMDDPGLLYAVLAAEMSFRARWEAAMSRPASLERTAALLNLAVAFMHAGLNDAALRDALGPLTLPGGAGISSGTISYLRGLCLHRLKRLQEARQHLEAAAGQPDATLWSHDGPPVAERARRLLATL